MAKADLKVTIDAEAAKLEREIERTTRSMQRMESQIRRTQLDAARLNKELDDQKARAVEKFGRGLATFGAAALAGLGLATKAAIDWESSWAGVMKTVEGSPEQLARVEEGLRELATTLPATHGEIAAVAEAAGQLGIATDDVVDFTRVMVMLGETTNLSASEAATQLARLMNIMGTAPADVERLGSTLVDLGNNAATTEAEISEMALRIAGAGTTIGLSEADVLAFATALSSVGIQAQAGGTAISRVMIEIADSVATGGDSLDQFAEVAGMSAQEFSRAFERDPASAIQAFVVGLGEIDTAGGNVFATLDELALGEIRVRDALLRMASAGSLLEENLGRSAQAWEDNTALVEEAERRFDTTEAKIQIAKNALVDLGIDIGGVVLPAVSGLAEGAADLFRAFSDLPGPVKTVVTLFGGLIGLAALAGGGFLLLAPRIAAARVEMQLLATTRPGVARAIGALGRAAGVAAGVVALVTVLGQLNQGSRETAVGVGQATEELLGLRDGVSSELISRVAEANRVLNETADVDVPGIGKVSLSFTTMSGTVRDAAGDLEEGLESIDQALAGMVSGGHADVAAESFAALAAEWEAGGGDVDRLRELLPGYADALAEADAQQELTAESMNPVDEGLQRIATQFGLTGEDAEKAAQDMLDAWAEASTGFVDVMDAYNTALEAKKEKEREAAEETAKATGEVSGSWDDMLGDVSLTIDEYLEELERQVTAQQNWQENMLILAGRVSAGTLDELARLGPEGAPLVEMLVNASDEELARFEELAGQRAEAGGQNFAQRLAEAEPVLKQIARDEGQEVANSIARGMAENGTTVEREARRQGVRIDRGVGTHRTRDVDVHVNLPTGLRRADGRIDSVARDRFTTIHVTPSFGRGATTLLRSVVHSGGEITQTGLRRFHGGGTLAHDERLFIGQTGERVLSRAQNEAFRTLMATLGSGVPVTPPTSGTQTVDLRITGSGPLFDMIQQGARTGQLQLSAGGARVTVG